MFVFFVNVSFLNVMTAQSTPILREWTKDTNPHLLAACTDEFSGSCYLMGLLPVVIYPICIFESIDKLGPFSLLGVVAVVYTAVVICYHGLVDPFHKGLVRPRTTRTSLTLRNSHDHCRRER